MRPGNRRGLIGADICSDRLVEPITGLHGFSAGGGAFIVRLDAHGGGETRLTSVEIELPPAMILPPAVVHPMTAVLAMITVIPIRNPYPIFLPPRSPDTPACRCFLRFVYNRRPCISIISVVCYRIGRRVFIKVNNIYVDGRFAGAAASGYGNGDGHLLRSAGCCPAYPRQLAVAIRIVNIADLEAFTVHIKSGGHRLIRITLTAADSDCCDDLGVHPILIIIDRYIGRFGRHILKAHDAETECRTNIFIGGGSGAAARPCGITEVGHLQEHG